MPIEVMVGIGLSVESGIEIKNKRILVPSYRIKLGPYIKSGNPDTNALNFSRIKTNLCWLLFSLPNRSSL